jgi:hypothetical protein
MNNDSFHYFSQLPLELRRLIWRHCLPHRIAEEDTPNFLLGGNELRQACQADRITHPSAQPPAIAFVNSESHQVTLEEGRWLGLQETTSLESIWVQPRRDVLHLNWTRLRYNVWGNADDPSSPIAMFLWRAEELGMQLSVVAEIIHPFSLKALLDGTDGADGADASNSPWLLYHDGRNNDVADIAYCAESQSRLDITMAAVSLHIPREAALRSGLFGLLGDAPVQMVDVGDEARLREFQALFREHALEKEPAVQTLFEAFTSFRFQTAWKHGKGKQNGSSSRTCGSEHEWTTSTFLGRTRALLGSLTSRSKSSSGCLSICPMRSIHGSSKLGRAPPSCGRGSWCDIVRMSVT